MNAAQSILVVDDEPDIRTLLKEILEDEGYSVTTAQNAAEARQARELRPALILLDIWMPDIDGITLLKEWTEAEPLDIPVIIMSGHATVETAVEATRLGAYDFIEKPLSLAKLLLTIEHALESFNLQRENAGLRREVHSLEEPVGRSKQLVLLREQTMQLAQHDTPVLITGEGGSGKALFARYLHNNSPRRNASFFRADITAMNLEEGRRQPLPFGAGQIPPVGGGDVVAAGLQRGGRLLQGPVLGFGGQRGQPEGCLLRRFRSRSDVHCVSFRKAGPRRAGPPRGFRPAARRTGRAPGRDPRHRASGASSPARTPARGCGSGCGQARGEWHSP